MTTLILSDLHLGSESGADLLRRVEIRSALLEALAEAERVVLLGDVLELRHGPMREAMAAARPFFEDLGEAMAGREIVITAGNHDHGLLEPWLAARGAEADPGPLSPEQLLEPHEASPALARIAEWTAPARLRVAYPGLWVRDDVYAMHGHYLDCHLTIPTLERLTMAAMSRMLRRPAERFDSVDDYESMGAPMFAWRDAVARSAKTGAALNGIATVNAWHALGGGSAAAGAGPRRPPLERLKRGLRIQALRRGFPVAVATLNRAGLGPLKPDVSGDELRRAGLEAMGEVAARLGLGDAHVVFGHTHRAGPLPGDDPAEWLGRGGARLVNCGSWTYASIFIHRRGPENPYWPGVVVRVGESGPPTVLSLLGERSLEELRPVRVAT